MIKPIISSLVIAAITTTAPLAISKDHKDDHKKNKPNQSTNSQNNPSKGALPPGLQKKVDRGGELPPGWQKKIKVGELIEESVYEKSKIVVPVDDDGLVTVEIGGKLIRAIEATREVIEILK